MRDGEDRAATSTTHVGDWSIVRVTGALDAETLTAVTAHLAPLLTWGARVALDVHGGGGGGDPTLIAKLVRRADEARAHLVLIESDDEVRESWRAAGLTRVHESLDEALRDTAAAARDHPGDTPLLPAAGDSQLVATEDLTGRPTAL